MPPSESWRVFCNIGGAVCDGLLAARAVGREAQRAPNQDAEVPPSWRAPRPSNTAPTPRSPLPDPPLFAPTAARPPAATTPPRPSTAPSPAATATPPAATPPTRNPAATAPPPTYPRAPTPAANPSRPPTPPSPAANRPRAPTPSGPAATIPTAPPRAPTPTRPITNSPPPPTTAPTPPPSSPSPPNTPWRWATAIPGASSQSLSTTVEMLCTRPLTVAERTSPITQPVAPPSPTIAADPPATEPEQVPIPTPTPPQEATPSPASPQPANEQAEVAAALASVVRVLDDIVEQAVGKVVADAFARLERSHAQDLSALAEQFEAALERQDKRHHEQLERLLERQDARLQELLTSQTKTHADDLRAALLELHPTQSTANETTAFPAAIEELQETMRLGFGELRAALNQGNHELTRLRTECTSLTTTLSRLIRPADPPAAETRDEHTPPSPHLHPTPARSPPIRQASAPTTRRLDALHDDDDDDDDDPPDPPSRPLRYRPPDDDAEPAHVQEASA